jgi:UDP-GlcNAc:undecaprenyl-phosphate GlcNAc-1-phosphate transferase
MKFIVFALISFALMSFATPVVVRLSRKFYCFDVPGKRKFHFVATPRWGGIAMFITVAVVLLTSMDIDRSMVSYLVASLVLVVVGTLDDWRPLGWKIKMAATVAAVTMVVFGGGTVVRRIGVYDSLGPVESGLWSLPFTYFGMIGVTNAINLIDGLNGLAAGASLLGFLFIGLAAAVSGNNTLVVMSAVFIGVLAAFLPYNFPKAKTFMGDSGSLLLGFSLAVFSIRLTQDAQFSIDAMYPFLVLLLPIFDAVRVMVYRIFKLKNPFIADKSHLHHLLVRRKLSQTNTVILLWLISLAFGVSALTMVRNTSMSFLTVAIFGVLFLGLCAELLVRMMAQKRQRLARPPLIVHKPIYFPASFDHAPSLPEVAMQAKDRATVTPTCDRIPVPVTRANNNFL